MKTISIDLDDWSVLNNRLDLLLRLKETYPKFKVSLFTIPYDVRYEADPTARIMRDKTLVKIKENLDWMEFIPHGLTHFNKEFEKCTYDTMKNYVFKAIDDAFKRDGLPYVKGFKAPFWLWNKGVVRALDEAGWWGAIDKNRRLEDPKTKRFYVFTHGIDEWYSRSNLDVIKLHGHMTNEMGDGLEHCFLNLFKIPSDVEFKFASEMVEEELNIPSTFTVRILDNKHFNMTGG